MGIILSSNTETVGGELYLVAIQKLWGGGVILSSNTETVGGLYLVAIQKLCAGYT